MRPVIAVTAFLLSFSTVYADAGDRFLCHVPNIQSTAPDGHQDHAFLESNRQKKYEITVLTDTIVTVFTFRAEIFSRAYEIVKRTTYVEIASRTGGSFGTETIGVSRQTYPKYGNMYYPVTITSQSGIYVNAWSLLCVKAN
jgi:hypothetical protein